MTSIDLEKIQKAIAEFTIIGLRPLLCDKKPPLKVGINPPKVKNQEDAFARTQYLFEKDGNKVQGFPASGIKKCIISACGHCSAVKSHTMGRVFIEPDINSEHYVQILTKDNQIPKPTLFSMTAGKGPGKGSVAQTVARFDDWKITFDIVYFPALITLDDVSLLLQLGGALVGLGARRLETGDNHRYGEFRLATALDK